MGHPLALPVALPVVLLVGLATAYCLARCVVPRWRHEHGAGVDAWHVAMGTAMVAMLLAPVGGWSATLQAGAFGIGTLWCVCVLVARTGTGAHVRLGTACAVMVAMLMPAVVAAPASAASAASPTHHHAGTDLPGTTAMAMPPVWLVVAMLVGVVAVAVAALRAALAEENRRTASRLGLACEVVMAGAMGCMAALAT
jgi:hypothetical protein